MTNSLPRKIRLVHCAFARGSGGGIPRMDTFYHRFLDRGIFDVSFVIPGEEDPKDIPFDPSIEYRYTGREGRFEKMVEIFADADIVQFSGGFAPAICEAAIAAQVPAIVEIMHLCEPGRMYPEIDVSICVSRTVEKFQPDKSRTVVIHNGIDVDEFPFRNEPLADDRIVILESSRREKPKHFHLDELAADILAIDHRIEIWMAGRHQTGASTDRVKFLGLRSDMPPLYQQADVMALFSRVEPFGLAAVEGMACGAPPIVSGDGGMAEIVTNGVDGWIVNGADKDSIITAVREAAAMRGSERWENMRRRARKTVEERFDARLMIREYEKVYLNLAESKGLRKTSGPLNAEPCPEVWLDETVKLFHEKDWDALAVMAGRMAALRPFKISSLAHTALNMAIHAAANGQNSAANDLYMTAHKSGMRGAEWMRNWVEIMPGGPLRDRVLSELMAMRPDDAEVVILAVEEKVNAGDLAGAVKLLEDSMARMPGNETLLEIYTLLKGKLGR
ncbi:MAG: glycosyltransferase family 4 protein [Nitrospinae bacterium]|nr:glycosyltransferase family 4 protein [Nitrospinota bacterium]